MHPHRPQIGDFEEVHSSLDIGAFHGVSFHDDTGGRGFEQGGLLHLAGLLQTLDLRGGDVPVFKAGASRGQ